MKTIQKLRVLAKTFLTPMAFMLLIPGYSTANEEWHCWNNPISQSGQPILKLFQGEDKKTGTVEVFGETLNASVSIRGITKRWKFGEDDQYVIEIEPGGTAYYLDFSLEDKVKPSKIYNCSLYQPSEDKHQTNSVSENPMRDAYILAIQQKIKRNWIRPQGSDNMRPCGVKVKQKPGGIILRVSFVSCKGSTPNYRASIENAVYKSEPLPKPAEPGLFAPEITLVFSPDKSSKRKRSADEIESVFHKNKGGIFDLYNRALRKNPSLGGQVVVELTISPDGRVTAARVLSSELDDETLERNLIWKIKRFRFPKANVPEITVTYPIDFLPS